LKAKNSLVAADAKLVEDAFEQQLRRFLPVESEERSEAEPTSAHFGSLDSVEEKKTARASPQRIESGIPTVQRAKRRRNKAHLFHVAQQPCLICARKPADPHHLRFMQRRALGLKVSDEFTVPLCRAHHREAHHAGNERAWWQSAGIDPVNVSRRLWEETRGGKKGAAREAPAGEPKEAHGSAEPVLLPATAP
jgi:hypothetical protein